jgi:8-oxo-dGTP pyrophosphatase MutT (NUDIX family)
MLVDFEEKGDGSVVLTTVAENSGRRTATSITTDKKMKHKGVPLGRASDCPTLTPRALEDDKFDRRRRPFVSLAVVGIVVIGDDKENENETRFTSSEDGTNTTYVLITRRPSYMRSFPGAFVFPGGNVDADDESLGHALSREIMEETGLDVAAGSWKLECLWESIYPTQLPLLVETEATATNTAKDIDEIPQDGAIKAHHLVCYFSGRPQNGDAQKQQHQQQISKPCLKLCEEEVDGAVWMSRNNIRDMLEVTAQIESNDDHGLPETAKQQSIALHTAIRDSTKQDSFIPLSDLAGIYPCLDETNNRFCGMAQGSLFALEEFVRNENRNESKHK